MHQSQYRIVRLCNGTHSIHSLAEAETFHPVVGPTHEAEALYVRQLRLVQRAYTCFSRNEEFVIWDVGLGAAANPITFLAALEKTPCSVTIVSFDHTLEPLRFALGNLAHLPYLTPFAASLQKLAQERSVEFGHPGQKVTWNVHVADFPTLISGTSAEALPKPHAIMFDAFSPAKNPAMWSYPVFHRIFSLLQPNRPCVLPTYSRSTLLRVTLLLAGFYVGVGHPTGEKEETTVAANSMDLIEEPLDKRWLERVKRSNSAEPLWEAAYRQAPLSEDSWQRLVQRPQFQDVPAPKLQEPPEAGNSPASKTLP